MPIASPRGGVPEEFGACGRPRPGPGGQRRSGRPAGVRDRRRARGRADRVGGRDGPRAAHRRSRSARSRSLGRPLRRPRSRRFTPRIVRHRCVRPVRHPAGHRRHPRHLPPRPGRRTSGTRSGAERRRSRVRPLLPGNRGLLELAEPAGRRRVAVPHLAHRDRAGRGHRDAGQRRRLLADRARIPVHRRCVAGHRRRRAAGSRGSGHGRRVPSPAGSSPGTGRVARGRPARVRRRRARRPGPLLPRDSRRASDRLVDRPRPGGRRPRPRQRRWDVPRYPRPRRARGRHLHRHLLRRPLRSRTS